MKPEAQAAALARAQRAAFRVGVEWGASTGAKTHPTPEGPCEICDREAARLYPSPMLDVPRVITADGVQYRVERGQIYANRFGGWMLAHGNNAQAVTPARVAAWADLLANPTERVPAE